MYNATEGYLPNAVNSCYNDTLGYKDYRRRHFCFLKNNVGINFGSSLEPNKAVRRGQVARWMRQAQKWMNNNRPKRVTKLSTSPSCYDYWVDCGKANNKGIRMGMGFVGKHRIYTGWDVPNQYRNEFRPDAKVGNGVYDRLKTWRIKAD